jgi:uncharacterized protein YdiU (UPF0061 family)
MVRCCKIDDGNNIQADDRSRRISLRQFFRSRTPRVLRASATFGRAGTPVAVFNDSLAEELGLDLASLDTTAIAAIFAGNTLPDGAEPLAQAYAGHQFGGFSPQLGDGRALLLGEVIDRPGAV